MPVFLDEDMMGRDAATIGFPHLLVCMGFVARTNNDIWGVHLTTVTSSKATFAGFWGWAQNKGLAVASITDIYGCCNRAVRYPAGVGRYAWSAEMNWFATHLGWNGPAHGFDTSIINPVDGTYVEYHHQLGGGRPCLIFYKRHEKTVDIGAVNIADNAANDIRGYSSYTGGYKRVVSAKQGMLTTTGSPLHEVNYALRLTNIQV